MNDVPNQVAPDRYQLLDLIAEYSAKLRLACDAYHQRRFRVLMIMMVCFVVIGAAVMGWLVLTSEKAFSPAGTALAGIGGIMIPLVMVSYLTIMAQSELRRSRFDITPLAHALEALVSHAAHLDDHGAESQDQRLYLQLRVAEATSALEYADWVFRSSTFSFFGSPAKEQSPTTRHYRSRSF